MTSPGAQPATTDGAPAADDALVAGAPVLHRPGQTPGGAGPTEPNIISAYPRAAKTSMPEAESTDDTSSSDDAETDDTDDVSGGTTQDSTDTPDAPANADEQYGEAPTEAKSSKSSKK